MKTHIITSLFLILGFTAYSQNQTSPEFFQKNGTNLQDFKASEDFDNIKVEKLAQDSLSSSFLIWVKKKVKAHKHVEHSENVYVLEGEGKITVGNETFIIRPGSYIFIPANTVHAVVVDDSKGVMKVLSVQSPFFDGSDRHFIAPPSLPRGEE